jgi:hypothetical protein
LGGIDVRQLFSLRRLEIGEVRAQSSSQLLHREALAVDEPLDHSNLVAGNDARESGGSSEPGKHGAAGYFELFDHFSQEGGLDERHIARQEQFSQRSAGHESGVDAAQGPATRDDIAANQSDRKSQGPGGSSDPLQESHSAAELEIRFVAPHPAAQATSEDADGEGRLAL